MVGTRAHPSAEDVTSPEPDIVSLQDQVSAVTAEVRSLKSEIAQVGSLKTELAKLLKRMDVEESESGIEVKLPVSQNSLLNTESPVSVSCLFSSNDKEAVDLTGLKLKLPTEQYLNDSAAWPQWLNLVVEAMEATGWEEGQPLTKVGDARLGLVVSQNVSKLYGSMLSTVRGGVAKLSHLEASLSIMGLRRRQQVTLELHEMQYVKGQDPLEFVLKFRLLLAKFREKVNLPDEEEIVWFLQAVRGSCFFWAQRISDMLRMSTNLKPQDVYDLFVQDLTRQQRPVSTSESKRTEVKFQSRPTKVYATNSSENTGNKSDTPSWSPGDRAQRNVLCYKCGRRGHVRRECNGKFNPERVKEERAKENGEKRVTENPKSNNVNGVFPVFSSTLSTSITENSSKTSLWLFDTGSDIHITNDRSDLRDIQEIPHDKRTAIATGGGTVWPSAEGAISVSFMGEKGKTNTSILKQAVFIEGFPVKIISGERFFRGGGEWKGRTLVFPNGREFATINVEKRGFYLWESGTPEPTRPNITANHHIGASPTARTLESDDIAHLTYVLRANAVENGSKQLSDEATRLLILWHRRLAHCSAERLAATIKSTTGITVDAQTVRTLPCKACDKAKIVKIPSHDPFTPAQYAGESTHFDLGAIKPESIDGTKYFELRTDLYSRFRDIVCHRTKTEVADSMIQALEQRAKQLAASGRVVRNVHIDGARELTNEGVSFELSKFEKFCQKANIRITMSAPHNHHQNGYSERGIRLLQDAARATAIQMRIPSVFWDRLLVATAYVTNRTATKSLGGKIPLLVFRDSMKGGAVSEMPPRDQQDKNGIKNEFSSQNDDELDLSHLRVLGSLCTVFVEPSERTQGEKLAARGVKGILLGYEGSHNFLFWLIDGGRWLRTPNAIFHEDVSPGPTGGTGVPQLPDPREVVRSLPPAVQRRLRHRPKPKTSIRQPDFNVVEGDVTDNEGETRPKRGRPKRVVRQVYVAEAPNEDDEILQAAKETAVENQHFHDIESRAKTTNYDFTNDERNPTLKQALEGPCRVFWEKAIFDEILQLLERGTFAFFPKSEMPKVQNAVSAKFVLREKKNPDGTHQKFKARLVARGFTQRKNIDYKETFSSTARSASWRILLALAVVHGWETRQVDFVGAYLHGDLHEEIWMTEVPMLSEFFSRHFELKRKFGYNDDQVQIQLRRPLYGLKQAGAEWQRKIRTILTKFNMHPLITDEAVYKTSAESKHLILAASHVDDFLLVSPRREWINKLIDGLKENIECTEGPLTSFLGVNVERNSDTITLDQNQYLKDTLKETSMDESRPVATPMVKGIETITYRESNEERASAMEYAKAHGKIMYAATSTRPDLAYAVGFWARFTSNPALSHYAGLKRVLRYIRNTADLRLQYKKHHNHQAFGPLGLHGVVDASFASDADNARSTTGTVFYMAGAPVMWSSKLQPVTAQSTSEAEFYAINEAAREAAWLREFLTELSVAPEGPIIILNDNSGALAWSNGTENGNSVRRRRHIKVRYQYVKEQVDAGSIKIVYVPTDKCAADGLTKALDNVKHWRNVEMWSQVRPDRQ